MGENARKLCELFVKFGLITHEQATSVLLTKKLIRIELDSIDLDNITKPEVIGLLQQLINVPYVEFEDHEVNKDAVEKVSESIARKYGLVALSCDANRLVIAMSDPLNILALDDLRISTGMAITPMFANATKINNAISIHYGKQQAMQAAEEYKKEQGLFAEELDDEEERDREEAISSAPIVKMLNSIVEQAVRTKASDIHIEAFSDYIRIRYRLDGQLKSVMKHDLRLLPALITRLKISANMNIAEMRRPQDGRFGRRIDNVMYDFRVSIIPAVLGEKAVIRIINKDDLLREKTDIITIESDMKKLNDIIRHPHGILVITGPTGSGKSTTMYSIISEKNDDDTNILTVEDPVEAIIEGANQIQVNNKANVTFANALRAFLRQDPDVIVVGEIRDRETAEIAVRAAVTGHLVISTLHTNDASGSIVRLIDMEIEPVLISASMIGVISQRLVKRICQSCKEEYEPEQSQLSFLEGVGERPTKLWKGKGCKACNDSGYKGRIAAFEILQVTPEMRKLITRRATSDEIKELATAQGMDTLKVNCSKLVMQGITTIDELIRISYEVE